MEPRGIGTLVTVVNGYFETFVTIDADIDPSRFHARTLRLGGGDGKTIYVDRRMILSELLVYHCQNVIVRHLTESEDMTSAHIRYFFRSITGHDIRPFNLHEWKREHGLDWRRMNDAAALFRAIAVYRGSCRKMPRLELALVDLHNKGNRVLEHERASLFRYVFPYKVEFDNAFDDETIAEMESSLSTLIGLGVLVTLNPDTTIRFRRFSGNIEGLYVPSVRTVLISRNHIGCFIHEFAHALDHSRGSVSKTETFTPLYTRYCEHVSRLNMERTFDSQYYFRRTEAFARMFESYIYSITGPNAIMRDVADSCFHVINGDLLIDIKRYFDSLLNRRSASNTDG